MKKPALAPLLLLLSLAPLGAGTWRVGLVCLSGADDPFYQNVRREAERVLLRQETVKSEDQARTQEDAKWATWQAWSDSYAKNAPPTAETGQAESPDSGILAIELDENVADDSLVPLLEEDALWYCRYRNLDDLLLVSSESLAGHTRCVIRRLRPDTEEESTVFDQLSFVDDTSDLTAGMTVALLETYTGRDLASLTLANAPPTLIVTVDGIEAEREGDFVIVDKGMHTVLLSAPGYVSRESEIDISGEAETVDADLVPVSLPPLSLISESGTATWYLNGHEFATGSSVIVEDLRLPMLITADKEGWRTLNRQITEDPEVITFRFTPDWQDDAERTRRLQKRFYGSFLALIVSAGLTIAYPTLYHVYWDDSYISGSLYVAAQGAAAMSTVALVRYLVMYSKDVLAH